MQRFLFAVFLIVTCTTGAAAGPYEDATSALQRENYALAARLFRPLAEQGNVDAQFNLGLLYGVGQGVPQDYQEAVKWYLKAAEQGQVLAQNNLAVMYTKGEGVPQDYQEAVKWYRLAAKQGNAGAQGQLAVRYANGQGVPKDFIRAHMWSNLAATALSGNEGKAAMGIRDRVASKMSTAHIEKAQEMARRCQESKFKECD
jgi:TPR repeat protein